MEWLGVGGARRDGIRRESGWGRGREASSGWGEIVKDKDGGRMGNEKLERIVRRWGGGGGRCEQGREIGAVVAALGSGGGGRARAATTAAGPMAAG